MQRRPEAVATRAQRAPTRVKGVTRPKLVMGHRPTLVGAGMLGPTRVVMRAAPVPRLFATPSSSHSVSSIWISRVARN